MSLKMESQFGGGSLSSDLDTSPRPLFIEMAQLSLRENGPVQWRQVARWVKYEEVIEQGGQRWSKPFVPTIQLNAVKELRSVLETSVIRLNFDCNSEERACRTLVDVWVSQGMIQESERNKVLQALLRPHIHLYETVWSLPKANKLFKKKKGKPNARISRAPAPEETSDPRRFRRSSICSVVYVDPSKEDKEKNVQFLRKIPANAESANIMVGQIAELKRPVGAFLRFEDSRVLGNLTEVPVPTKFIFILLTPPGFDHYEMGRAVGTLFTDPIFKETAYQVSSKEKLFEGIDNFMNKAAILPPATWDKSIRLEPPQSGGGAGHGESHGAEPDADSGLARTGVLFGGLWKDIRRKVPWYWSDVKDALSLQCLATWMFLYFACLTPMITFGGLMGLATHNSMGTMETMVAGCVCGIGFALFSGQPLIILGSTGPVLVFEKILVNFSESNGWDYLEFRLWVGVWIAVILIILVATDASALVSYITRFTEDNFATLIALIFMVEAVKNVMLIGHTHTHESSSNNSSLVENETMWNWENEVDHGKVESDITLALREESSRSIFLMSLLLFAGTFFVSSMLKEFRVSPFFPTWFRYIVSDFAVILAIASMTFIDFSCAVRTPKLAVPEKFAPTSSERGWFIPPFGKNPIWSIFAASIPALLATILIFMDQQITAVIVNRKDHKLKKGCGYHLDLFVLAILITLGSFFGLPWFVAATVESLTNVSSLKMESESAAPGEKPTFLGVREQRVSNLLVFITVGLSVFLTPVLCHVPMPVLYGVFLYMGFSALLRMDLFQRILLVFMPLKYQPDRGYLRSVPLRRVHLFTLIQLLCLVLLWIIKSLKQTAILFPLMLVVMMLVRKLLDYVFTQTELLALDDALPGSGKCSQGSDHDEKDGQNLQCGSRSTSTEFNGCQYKPVTREVV
ncbi:sodium-driven chloride bicarbonate exchanger [Folsomia candida]|uniref:sodium-driven chloride bicarbonate exchanger n=1 Tax=Folsomia candida TaxID=158441 RepID=UPI000B8F7453|nr:sodium-driven chloride bicarbonate exchanger [Folsomia candida]